MEKKGTVEQKYLVEKLQRTSLQELKMVKLKKLKNNYDG